MTKEELSQARRKFNFQRWNSHRRVDRLGNPIEWHLSFDQWLDIWIASGQWNNRGTHSGQYVMSRKNDIGHYELGNIEIKLSQENSKEASTGRPSPRKGLKTSKEVKDKISKKLKDHTKTQDHRKKLSKASSKPVMTLHGRFDSIKQAEKILKKDWYWQSKKDPDNWYYIE